MIERVLIAGSGGQGVVLLGKLLAAVAAESFPHVTFFPAYGAEVRGGTSNCQVILSSDEIASPVSEQFDSLVIMNQLSADRFMSCLDGNTIVILNSSLCDVPQRDGVFSVPASKSADELGDSRVANLIMLGAYVGKKSFVRSESVEKELSILFSEKGSKLIDLNVRAFRFGLSCMSED